MKFFDYDDSYREGVIQPYITDRWRQLWELESDLTLRVVNLLVALNSGGALATITFMGITDFHKAWWTRAMLVLFLGGVIVVAVLAVMARQRTAFVFSEWRKATMELYAEQLDWEDLIKQDAARSAPRLCQTVLGFASLLLFVAACTIGASNLIGGKLDELPSESLETRSQATANHSPAQAAAPTTQSGKESPAAASAAASAS